MAFAAGFASVRQFNDTVREVFAQSPREMRRRAARGPAHRAATADDSSSPTLGVVSLRLPFRTPLDPSWLLHFFAARAVPGIEEVDGQTYRRTLRAHHGRCIVELTPGEDHMAARLHLQDLRDLGSVVARCRLLLDLDADPRAVDEALARDPLLAPAVSEAPGARVPGTADGAELAVRAVLGQQVSVAAARGTTARIVAALGEPLARPLGGLTHLFPEPDTLAAVDPATLPVPKTRAATIQTVAGLLADGALELDAGADRDETRRRLLAIRGVGPWTVEYIAMRALADPDAFPATDLGALRGLAALGAPADAGAAARLSQVWRPWRAYALQHLWRVAGLTAESPPAHEPPDGSARARQRPSPPPRGRTLPRAVPARSRSAASP